MTTKPTIVPLVDLETVSKQFGVSPKTLRRWWQAGRFPQPIRIGRQRFWRVADVNKAIADKADQASQAVEPDTEKEPIQ